MNNVISYVESEQGSITLYAFIILVVLTLLGVFATRTATIDLQIASNETTYKQDFYVAEGGSQREAAELGRGSYPITDINAPRQLATQASVGLPAPSPHRVLGRDYNFMINYIGHFPPPSGYSIIHFRRYDYTITSTENNVRIAMRCFKVGPKSD